MNTKLFSSYSEKLLALKNTRVDFAVQVLLGRYLEALGVNPFSSYLNTLADFPNPEVGSSETLFDEALAWVEKQRVPNYKQGVSNVFNKRYSFAVEDRVRALDLIAFEKIVSDIVTQLTEKPAMDLSWRSIKPLSVEDVHGALKLHLPGVDLDKVYVTGFVTHGAGERVVSSSEPLVDYLLGHFDNNEIPYHSKGDHQAIYMVPFSGDDRHLHPRLAPAHLNDLMIKIVPDLLG
ncbi:hypothetical protein [Pseudomonas sp. NFACC05-1]|uniref:hypothetical protein n=1 Tax=Pseudomonas sp. NFACC05-1 TaxID=1566241 RepID=UPI0008716533|nr:hypothetical protein [Pseudomonas sp. NFACC05-1]SCW68996.1 hypothetical protein SAMN03159424_02476 [Pseudomonas sp. NFACC05-1]